jgi:predicted transposase YdaD
MFSKFLTEKELARFNEISEAIEVLETKNFTPEQIRGYELYLDNMRTYVTNMSEARREGMEMGIEQGMEKGIKEGIEEGKAMGKAEGIAEGRNQIMDNTFAILDDLKNTTLTIEQIAEKHDATIHYVQQLKKYSS